MTEALFQVDSARASAVTGHTAYMLDYLARAGIVKPSVRAEPGRGRRRQYAFGDLVTLRVVRKLLAAGVSVAKLKRSLAKLQSSYGRHFANTPADFFCSDGESVFLRSADDVIADISNGGQQVFTFMLDLRQLHKETLEAVKNAA